MDTRLFSSLHKTMTWGEYCKTSKQTKTRIPLFFPFWIWFGLAKADEGWIVFCIRGPIRSSSNLQHSGCQRALETRCCFELLGQGEGQQREGEPQAQHCHQPGKCSLCEPHCFAAPGYVRGPMSSAQETAMSGVRWVVLRSPSVQLWHEWEHTEESESALAGPLTVSQQLKA